MEEQPEADELEASAVRRHPLFKKLSRQLGEERHQRETLESEVGPLRRMARLNEARQAAAEAGLPPKTADLVLDLHPDKPITADLIAETLSRYQIPVSEPEPPEEFVP